MPVIRQILYQEWSEQEGKVIRTLLEQSVSGDDVFVRKLVNATSIRNQLFEHTSHESEDGQRHTVYVKPLDESNLDVYGTQMKQPLFDHSAPSPYLEPEFYYWNGHRFEHGPMLQRTNDTLEMAQMLLDHFLVVNGRTYETVYSVLDTDRNKIVLYMKEVFS